MIVAGLELLAAIRLSAKKMALRWRRTASWQDDLAAAHLSRSRPCGSRCQPESGRRAARTGPVIGMTPQTARRWLKVMDGSYQCFQLPAFSGNPAKRVMSGPKGSLADAGLACFQAEISSPQALGGHPLFGPLFEMAKVCQPTKQAAALATRRRSTIGATPPSRADAVVSHRPVPPRILAGARQRRGR